MWSTDEDRSAVTMTRAVGFADLVGYTSAAASMSVRELTAVLAEFDERTANVVLRGDGQLVKTIGDEAMFVTEELGFLGGPAPGWEGFVMAGLLAGWLSVAAVWAVNVRIRPLWTQAKRAAPNGCGRLRRPPE
jgi:class 3 adenylate cyclase